MGYHWVEHWVTMKAGNLELHSAENSETRRADHWALLMAVCLVYRSVVWKGPRWAERRAHLTAGWRACRMAVSLDATKAAPMAEWSGALKAAWKVRRLAARWAHPMAATKVGSTVERRVDWKAARWAER